MGKRKKKLFKSFKLKIEFSLFPLRIQFKMKFGR